MSTTEQPEATRGEPLFRQDFKTNGGELAPYSARELLDWVSAEVAFWSWVPETTAGGHKTIVEKQIAHIKAAREEAQALVNGHGDANEHLNNAQARLRSAFLKGGMPHSSSALGKEVEEIRRQWPSAALSFLVPQLPEPVRFDVSSADHQAWYGFLLGLYRKYDIPTGAVQLRAQRELFEQMHGTANQLLRERRADYDNLKSDFGTAIESANQNLDSNQHKFDSFMADADKAHAEALTRHGQELESLRRTFKEGMALRAPVEYWQERQGHHQVKAKLYTWLAFGGLASLAVLLGGMATWAVRTSGNPFMPDVWRLVLLAFVSAVGVWTVRLLVRLLLSHLHLETDAAERVTMVKTYLALTEADKLTKDEDRKLILQPLFRPGADGMVKDEGIPHPVLEFLTRSK